VSQIGPISTLWLGRTGGGSNGKTHLPWTHTRYQEQMVNNSPRHDQCHREKRGKGRKLTLLQNGKVKRKTLLQGVHRTNG